MNLIGAELQTAVGTAEGPLTSPFECLNCSTPSPCYRLSATWAVHMEAPYTVAVSRDPRWPVQARQDKAAPDPTLGLGTCTPC
jgi:hypothetical protein